MDKNISAEQIREISKFSRIIEGWEWSLKHLQEEILLVNTKVEGPHKLHWEDVNKKMQSTTVSADTVVSVLKDKIQSGSIELNRCKLGLEDYIKSL